MMFGFWSWIIYVVILFFLAGLKIVKEYERGVRFTLGKYSGVIKPGLRLVIPIVQSWRRVDVRVKAIDVPDQEGLRKELKR